jgi:hypothetical protein
MDVPRCSITSVPLAHCQCGRHGQPVYFEPDPKPRCHGTFVDHDGRTVRESPKPMPTWHYVDRDDAATPPIPSKKAVESRCECNRYPGRGHATYCPEYSSRGGRVPNTAKPSGHRSDTVPGTALLRSTLEALECLLRSRHYIDAERAWPTASATWRRAIQDMVAGPFDNWARNYFSNWRHHRTYTSAVSDTFWLALNAWVGGASAREQLQSSVRQLLNALDDSEQSGRRTQPGVQLPGHQNTIEDEGDEGSDPSRPERTQVARDKLGAGL